MKRIVSISAAALLTVWAFGCSSDEPKTEEPVQPSENAESGAEGDAATAPDDGTSQESLEQDAAPVPPDESAVNKSPQAPPPAPMANPSTAQPAPEPTGGIISGGDKEWDDCKKIPKFNDRKKCFAKAQKLKKAKP